MRTLKKIIFYFRLILANEYKKANIYRRYLDIKIGNNVRITSLIRFGSEPYLIEIGENVTITRGVCFVNHDGSVALFRKQYPGLNVYGKIKIGNNVFIGLNSLILQGVTIGDNVIIGAGSVVTKDIPNNSVAAGVPAKVIKSVDEYKTSILTKSIIIKEDDYKSKKRLILEHLK